MSNKFGLGRGLDDLKQEMGQVPDISMLTGMSDRVVVKNIPINQIGVNPANPRKTFSESELKELADSIKEKGVIQPILLRSVNGLSYNYEIVAGERRYRASKLAGLTEIPALIKKITDANSMEIALIENVQRENLNPIEESCAYRNIMDKCGYSFADVSRIIGKSESYIRNILRLETLPDDVKDMVKSGELSLSHARAIAVAEDPISLAKQIVAQNISVADTEKLVKSVQRSKKSRSFMNTTIKNDAVVEIEQKLSRKLGVKVVLKEKKGGAGSFILFFDSRTQMQDLVARLTKQ